MTAAEARIISRENKMKQEYLDFNEIISMINKATMVGLYNISRAFITAKNKDKLKELGYNVGLHTVCGSDCGSAGYAIDWSDNT